MNEVKRYEVKTIQFTTKQESDLYRELQSERAARIEAETKLHELQEIILSFPSDLLKPEEKSYKRMNEIWDNILESRKRREEK